MMTFAGVGCQKLGSRQQEVEKSRFQAERSVSKTHGLRAVHTLAE
jgi:hypothetical protein